MHFELVASQFAEQALTMFNVTEEGIAVVAENVCKRDVYPVMAYFLVDMVVGLFDTI